MLFRLPSEEELTDNKLNEFIAKHNAECAFRFKHLKDAYETDYQIFHQKPKPDYKPDNRIAVNFAKYMVDTFNGYFIGNPIKISVDGDAADNIKKYVELLDQYNDQDDNKYKLQGMSNLAKTKERKFTSGMNRRYKLIFSNPVSGMKEDDWVKLHYHFTPNIPSNVLEESQIAGNLDGIVSQETQLGVLSVVDNVQGEIDRIQQEENQKAEYMVLGRNENSILEMITIIKEYAERNGEEPVDVFNKILGEGVNGNEE